MSGHTPGPWHICPLDQASHRWVIAQPDGSSVADCSPVGPWVPDEMADANARLIAAAPAMELALQLIAEGHARIERTGDLREFCFDGIRYAMNGKWGQLFDVIGWDRAIAEATGEQP